MSSKYVAIHLIMICFHYMKLLFGINYWFAVAMLLLCSVDTMRKGGVVIFLGHCGILSVSNLMNFWDLSDM